MKKEKKTSPTSKTDDSRKEKRFETLNSFCDIWISKYELSLAEIAVYLIIYRNGRNGRSFVTVSRIAQCLGLTKRHIYNTLQKLYEKNIVVRNQNDKCKKYFSYACKLTEK